MRKPLIAGNWKMNNTLIESKSLIDALVGRVLPADREYVICPPYTALSLVGDRIKETPIVLGAQNMHHELKGAYTGEISPQMLKELQVAYVIVGHSERRQLFNETNKSINEKVKMAVKQGMHPILCVGESLAQREGNMHERIVKSQLIEALKDVDEEGMRQVVIAYEPVWAIGTGRTATSKQANKMAGFIREVVSSQYDKKVSESIQILYGGSVKPSNIDELMAESDIDGALVGGASLKAEDFYRLMTFGATK